MSSWQIFLVALVVVVLIGALARGAMSKRSLHVPVCELALDPGKLGEATWVGEIGATYELWLRMRLEGVPSWALRVRLEAFVGDASAVDETRRLHDDGDGGIAGLPTEGVVTLDQSSEYADGRTKLATTCLLGRV